MRRQKFCNKIQALLAILAFVMAPALAQVPNAGSKWWKDERIISELRLTSQQRQQLEKIMGDFRGRLNALVRELEARRREREKLAKESGFNTDAYRALTLQIYTLKTELEKVNLAFRIRLSEVLTPRQKALLRKIQFGRK